jgi:hypothetical protein
LDDAASSALRRQLTITKRPGWRGSRALRPQSELSP